MFVRVRHILSHPSTNKCYTAYVREKEFINKVHKNLSKEIYRWKINDPYHGGVPDAFYSGPKDHCFIEYKYKESLPVKETSFIKIELSTQQRIWLKRQAENNINVYAVLGSGDLVYVTQDFEKEKITVKEFKQQAVSFTDYITQLTNLCLGNEKSSTNQKNPTS